MFLDKKKVQNLYTNYVDIDELTLMKKLGFFFFKTVKMKNGSSISYFFQAQGVSSHLLSFWSYLLNNLFKYK